jgi:UDP-N-acetylmuramoylalanine--D-glutamate ligase
MQSEGRKAMHGEDVVQFAEKLGFSAILGGRIDPTLIIDPNYWPALQGPHNAQNAVAAIWTSTVLGVDDEVIDDALFTYPGLPHRMERIRVKDGVLFVNDSKATNAEAAAPALAAYPKVRWILGGQAKTESLGDTEGQLSHVVKAYTIGEAGPMFARLLRERSIAVSECESLENAVKMAAEDSQAGEVVLLSPASASFDQFRDFEARGDRFRELVEGL